MKLIYNNKEVANNTKNYNELLNKPLLNSKELVGNVSLNDINVYNKKEVDNLIASTRSVKAVTALPSPLVENTMYYVGPDADDNYHVYLVDSALTLIDLGMAREETMYKEGAAIDIATDNSINVKLDYESVSLNSEGKIYVPTLSGTKGSDTKPVYLNDGQITASNGNAGNATRPVYLNSGTITKVNQVSSGNYQTAVPYIRDDGVMDVGPVIDFHNKTETDSKYTRLQRSTSAKTGLTITNPESGHTGYLVSSGTSNSVGSAIQPVYVNNGKLTSVNTLSPGTWSNNTGAIPQVIGSVMEMARHIDFHDATSTKDFDVRLSYNEYSGSGLSVSRAEPMSGGPTGGYIPITSGARNNVGALSMPVYVTNGVITAAQGAGNMAFTAASGTAFTEFEVYGRRYGGLVYLSGSLILTNNGGPGTALITMGGSVTSNINGIIFAFPVGGGCIPLRVSQSSGTISVRDGTLTAGTRYYVFGIIPTESAY